MSKLADGNRLSKHFQKGGQNSASLRRISIVFVSKNYCYVFHLFQVEWKTVQPIRELFPDYDQGTQVQRNMCGMNGGCRTTQSSFSNGKRVTWKKRKKTMTPFSRFSSSFHRNDHTLSGHLMLVTDDLKNVRKVKITKNAHF